VRKKNKKRTVQQVFCEEGVYSTYSAIADFPTQHTLKRVINLKLWQSVGGYDFEIFLATFKFITYFYHSTKCSSCRKKAVLFWLKTEK